MALDYELETDILKVPGPDSTLAVLPELQVAIHKLIEAVKHYDVPEKQSRNTGSYL